MTAPLAHHWDLDPDVTFLNHGSFGATPRVVKAAQRAWQDRMEREPVLFLHREIEEHLDTARTALGRFLGADPDDLVFVQNATTGVNTVLQRIPLAAGDELLVTDQEYNASRNALEFAAARAGARVAGRERDQGRHRDGGAERGGPHQVARRRTPRAERRGE